MKMKTLTARVIFTLAMVCSGLSQADDQTPIAATPETAAPIQTQVPTTVPVVEAVQDKQTQVAQNDELGSFIYNRNFVLKNKIMAKYLISDKEADAIVEAAEDNAYPDFPTKKDILSIIGIESSFRTKARTRSSFGLMQINYLWNRDKIGKKSDLFRPKTNIAAGAKLLHEYYIQLGSPKKAVLAYNAGIGNFLDGIYHTSYLRKFLKERSWLK